MKKLIIIFLFIIFSFGCVITPIKQNSEPELVKVSNNIFIQNWSKNIRSYHTENFDSRIYLKIGMIILNIVGVQSVEVKPYEIQVIKSPLFDWKLINKTMIMLINDWN